MASRGGNAPGARLGGKGGLDAYVTQHIVSTAARFPFLTKSQVKRKVIEAWNKLSPGRRQLFVNGSG